MISWVSFVHISGLFNLFVNVKSLQLHYRSVRSVMIWIYSFHWLRLLDVVTKHSVFITSKLLQFSDVAFLVQRFIKGWAELRNKSGRSQS